MNLRLAKADFSYPYTAWKVSKYGVFLAPNAGKYGPEKTSYLNTFHAMVM